jgi:hypothetical protein
LPQIVAEWSRNDLEAAFKWTIDLPEGPQKGSLVEKLPAGSGRDAAVTSFSVAASKTDPESAVAWATTIQNPDTNRSTVRNVYATWFRKDPAAASNWLQSARNISPELRSELQGNSVTNTGK